MKTFAFYNAKGGVGKTSSAVNVAYILAAVHNKRTLLIDLDPQSNATDFYNCYDDSDTQLTVEDLLAGGARSRRADAGHAGRCDPAHGV